MVLNHELEVRICGPMPQWQFFITTQFCITIIGSLIQLNKDTNFVIFIFIFILDTNLLNISTDEGPSLRIESHAIINLLSLSTKLN